MPSALVALLSLYLFAIAVVVQAAELSIKNVLLLLDNPGLEHYKFEVFFEDRMLSYECFKESKYSLHVGDAPCPFHIRLICD